MLFCVCLTGELVAWYTGGFLIVEDTLSSLDCLRDVWVSQNGSSLQSRIRDARICAMF